MKALSIKQPWAWLIINGHKNIENRTWNTTFRGRFLVHASKGFDKEAYSRYALEFNIPSPELLDKGGFVGTVYLQNVFTTKVSPWFEGPYGYMLHNPVKIDFKPYKGRLGFFEVES